MEAETNGPENKHHRLLMFTSSSKALLAFERLCPEAELSKRTADLLRHRGTQWHVLCRRGGADRDVKDRAMKDLSRAVDLYGEWMKKHPDDKEISDRQVETSMLLYAHRKYVSL